MKASLLALSLMASAMAAPANHGHGVRKHHHKREANPDIVIVWETITVGQDGQPLATILETTTQHETIVASTPTAAAVATSVAAVQEKQVVHAAASSSTTPTPAAVPTTSTQEAAHSSATSAVQAAAATQSSETTSSSVQAVSIEAGTVSNPLSSGTSPSVKFVDGTIACSSFPSSQEGVVSLDYLGYGGWTGIQLNNGAASSCQSGALCSYACQPGMLKTQWPTDQPSDGESRGGITCGSDGMLYLSDSSKPYLCEWGQNSAFINSELTQGVAICQTDYPASENMVIPTWVAAGASGVPLSVVQEDTYFKWEGQLTSSQFYVNNAGVSQEEGCQWGTAGSNIGNYAPLNFGAGYTDGITWLSLIPNPNTATTLNFNVEILPESGSTMNGGCKYVDGAFSGASATAAGCTVACTGSCYYHFY